MEEAKREVNARKVIPKEEARKAEVRREVAKKAEKVTKKPNRPSLIRSIRA